MAIKVVCPSCGAKRSLPDAYRGRPVTCPKCATKFNPDDAATASGSSETVVPMTMEAEDSSQFPVEHAHQAARGVASAGPVWTAPPAEPATRLAHGSSDTKLARIELDPGALLPPEPTPTKLPALSPAGSPNPQSHEYKVLTRKSLWFSGDFNPEAFQEALNNYAKQGWTLKSTFVLSIPAAEGSRDELVVILER